MEMEAVELVPRKSVDRAKDICGVVEVPGNIQIEASVGEDRLILDVHRGDWGVYSTTNLRVLIKQLAERFKSSEAPNACEGSDGSLSVSCNTEIIRFVKLSNQWFEDISGILFSLPYLYELDVRFRGVRRWCKVRVTWEEFPRHDRSVVDPVGGTINCSLNDELTQRAICALVRVRGSVRLVRQVSRFLGWDIGVILGWVSCT